MRIKYIINLKFNILKIFNWNRITRLTFGENKEFD